MVGKIKHTKLTTHPDDPNYDFSKEEWEDDHEVEEGTARIYSGLDANKNAILADCVKGNLYMAIDTGLTYRHTGSAWEEITRLETEFRLLQLLERSHNSLDDITENQHHTKFTTIEHDVLERHPLGTVVPHDALALLTEKSHDSLTDVTADQHHAEVHGDEQHTIDYEKQMYKDVLGGYSGLMEYDKYDYGKVGIGFSTNANGPMALIEYTPVSNVALYGFKSKINQSTSSANWNKSGKMVVYRKVDGIENSVLIGESAIISSGNGAMRELSWTLSSPITLIAGVTYYIGWFFQDALKWQILSGGTYQYTVYYKSSQGGFPTPPNPLGTVDTFGLNYAAVALILGDLSKPVVSLSRIPNILTGKTCPKDKTESVIIKADGSGDYATIQAALDAGETAIFVADGTHLVTKGAKAGALEFKADSQVIYGSRKAEIRMNESAYPVIYCNYANCGIYGVTIDGNQYTNARLISTTGVALNFLLMETKLLSYCTSSDTPISLSGFQSCVIGNILIQTGTVTTVLSQGASSSSIILFGNTFTCVNQASYMISMLGLAYIFGNNFTNANYCYLPNVASARAYIWGNRYTTISNTIYYGGGQAYFGYPECAGDLTHWTNQVYYVVFNNASRDLNMAMWKLLNVRSDSNLKFDCDIPDMLEHGLGQTILRNKNSFRIEVANGAGNYGMLSLPLSSIAMTPPTGFPFSKQPEFTIAMYVPLLVNSSDYSTSLRVCLRDLTASAEPWGTQAKGMEFVIYAVGGTNIFRIIAYDGTSSFPSSTVVLTAGWHTFRLKLVSATTVYLYLDGASSPTITLIMATGFSGAFTDLARCIIKIYLRNQQSGGATTTIYGLAPTVQINVIP